MKISVFGIGKAGLPLTCVIAQAGFQVIGVGRNKEKIDRLNKGINPIPEEKGLSELLNKYVGKYITFSNKGAEAVKQAKIHIIIVPLFINVDNKADYSNLKDCAKQIGRGLKKGDLVVIETTVPVGTTNHIIRPVLEKYSKLKAGQDYYLACSPERMMTGYAISRYQEYPKVIGGIDKKSCQQATNFYRHFCQEIITVSSIETAEMTKIVEGVYRDINIAIANEFLILCDRMGVDFWEIKKAATYHNSFCRLYDPGNVGGHCIPVYPWFLINSFQVPLTKTARILNDDMIKFYAKKAILMTGKKGVIIIFGISFRENVKETAYTRTIPLYHYLRKKGFRVYVYDPLYSQQETKALGLQYNDNFKQAKCIILMNYYPQIKSTLFCYRNKVIDIKNSLA